MPELLYNPYHSPSFSHLFGKTASGGSAAATPWGPGSPSPQLPPFFRAVAPAMIRPRSDLRAETEALVASLWPSHASTVGLQVVGLLLFLFTPQPPAGFP
jgi:hypothetical protein